MTTESLLTFPCDFVIKIFGLASGEFESAALQIIREHVPNLPDTAVQTNTSKNSKYKALTITVPVETREQLDQIYLALTACPLVLMAL